MDVMSIGGAQGAHRLTAAATPCGQLELSSVTVSIGADVSAPPRMDGTDRSLRQAQRGNQIRVRHEAAPLVQACRQRVCCGSGCEQGQTSDCAFGRLQVQVGDTGNSEAACGCVCTVRVISTNERLSRFAHLLPVIIRKQARRLLAGMSGLAPVC